MAEALEPPDSAPALSPAKPRLRGADVVSSVILQYRANFLLNELDVGNLPPVSQISPRLLIPGFVPRRRDDAPEMLHQARVSLRRMRSTIRIFSSLLDATWAEQMSGDLSWYGDVLGRARDLTVMRERILDGDLPIRSVAVRELLRKYLDAELDGALSAQRAARESLRYGDLIKQLLELEAHIAFTPPAFHSARRVLPPELDEPFKELGDAAREARRDKTAKNLHAVRIRAKRVQHGCEALALVLGKPVHRTARAAEALQRRLGTVHDASVCQEWLVELATSEPRYAAHLTQLAEFERVQAKMSRRGWRDDLGTLRVRWRRWH